ncbi:MAG: DoxX family protein [Microcystaceae cyanobacterium]
MPHLTSLLGRIFIALIFIYSGTKKIFTFEQTATYMASKNLPFTHLLLVVTIMVLLVGGLSVLLGLKTKIGAWLLIGFLIPTTFIFHGQLPEDTNQFLKNLGLIGGLLMIISFGAGKWSLDESQ